MFRFAPHFENRLAQSLDFYKKMDDKLTNQLSKSSRIIFGLLFFGIFIIIGILIFFSDNSGLYISLMFGFGFPFGALGFCLLFSDSRKREYGLLSPFTLRLCGIFCFVAGFCVIEEGAEGIRNGLLFFAGGSMLFSLAHKRHTERKRNKLL